MGNLNDTFGYYQDGIMNSYEYFSQLGIVATIIENARMKKEAVELMNQANHDSVEESEQDSIED